MQKSILSRYLDPEILSHIRGRRFEPRGLTLGNLAGAHKSPLAGFAVEFSGHREYVWGDDPKHIDWRVYFTRERYVVKQYDMETNLVCHFVLDSSASMRYGEGPQQKLNCAARLIIALAHAVLRQSDKASLAAFDDEIRGVAPPSNAMAQIVRMSELIEASQPVRKTRMGECLRELAGRFRRREIVMIFSDFFTDLPSLETALQRLRHAKHEVALFQTLHHDELAFDFEQLTRFEGLEAAEALMAQPEAVRRGYLEALRRFNGELESLCQRNRIERGLVDTSRNLGETLADYLNQRNLTRRGR